MCSPKFKSSRVKELVLWIHAETSCMPTKGQNWDSYIRRKKLIQWNHWKVFIKAVFTALIYSVCTNLFLPFYWEFCNYNFCGINALFLQGTSKLIHLYPFMRVFFFQKDQWNKSVKYMRIIHDPGSIFYIHSRFIQQIFIECLHQERSTSEAIF